MGIESIARDNAVFEVEQRANVSYPRSDGRSERFQQSQFSPLGDSRSLRRKLSHMSVTALEDSYRAAHYRSRRRGQWRDSTTPRHARAKFRCGELCGSSLLRTSKGRRGAPLLLEQLPPALVFGISWVPYLEPAFTVRAVLQFRYDAFQVLFARKRIELAPVPVDVLGRRASPMVSRARSSVAAAFVPSAVALARRCHRSRALEGIEHGWAPAPHEFVKLRAGHRGPKHTNSPSQDGPAVHVNRRAEIAERLVDFSPEPVHLQFEDEIVVVESNWQRRKAPRGCVLREGQAEPILPPPPPDSPCPNDDRANEAKCRGRLSYHHTRACCFQTDLVRRLHVLQRNLLLGDEASPDRGALQQTAVADISR